MFHASSHGIDMVGPQVGSEQQRLKMQHVCTEVELLWGVVGDRDQSWPQARVLPMAHFENGAVSQSHRSTLHCFYLLQVQRASSDQLAFQPAARFEPIMQQVSVS